MQKIARRHVVLPDGEWVQVSDAPEEWWMQHGASGHVDPKFLAPDPDQPRKEMPETELDELYESIKATGVREGLTVTPIAAAPWIRIAPENKQAFFAIVSGHRRDRGAKRAQLPAVPIHIRIYSDENAHRSDAGILNAHRNDLNEVEQGYEFVRLQKAGATINEIRAKWGKSAPHIYNRMYLTKLHPDIQRLVLVEKVTGKRILPVSVGSLLGNSPVPPAAELEQMAINFAAYIDATLVTGHESFDHLDEDGRRFAVQKMLVAVIRKRYLSSQQAAEFVRDKTLKFREGRHQDTSMQRYKPSRRKDVLMNLAKVISGTTVVDWRPDEYHRIFEYAPREELDAFITEMKGASDVLLGVIKMLSGIRDAKRPTSPEVLRLMAQRTQKVANV